MGFDPTNTIGAFGMESPNPLSEGGRGSVEKFIPSSLNASRMMALAPPIGSGTYRPHTILSCIIVENKATCHPARLKTFPNWIAKDSASTSPEGYRMFTCARPRANNSVSFCATSGFKVRQANRALRRSCSTFAWLRVAVADRSSQAILRALWKFQWAIVAAAAGYPK
jgi:hypothetical protein